MSDNTRCCICYEEKPPFGFEKWTCDGHNESICKECSNNCSNCPLCRAEPKIEIINNLDYFELRNMINQGINISLDNLNDILVEEVN